MSFCLGWIVSLERSEGGGVLVRAFCVLACWEIKTKNVFVVLEVKRGRFGVVWSPDCSLALRTTPWLFWGGGNSLSS